MKILLGAAMLFFLCANCYSYDIKEFQGVPVTYDQNKCGEDTKYGCYYFKGPYKGTINIKAYNSELHLANILTHEIGHHFYYTRLTYKERQTWRYISQYEHFEIMMNRHGINENCFFSDYAKTNDVEDFAETYLYVAYGRRYTRIENYCHVKIYVMNYFLEKYK